MRFLLFLLMASTAFGKPIIGDALGQVSWLNNYWSIPGYGLVAGWDLTSANTLQQSGDLTASPWTGNGVVTTAGKIGPTGAADAYELVFSGLNPRRYQENSATLAGSDPWTGSVWAVAAATVTIYLNVERPGPANSVYGTMNVTTTWTRFAVVHTDAWTGSGTIRYKLHNMNDTDTKTVNIWHPQLNSGTFPATYVPTTTHQSIPSILSGGSALQNGSASGADGNDGTWRLNGWVGDGAVTRCHTSISLGTSPRTLIAVAKSRITPASYGMLIGSGNTPYLAFSQGSGVAYAFSSNSWDSTQHAVANTTALALDTFAMIASVEDTGKHDVWLNTNVTRYTPTGSLTATEGYSAVGSFYQGNLYVLDGTIAYILIYNRALSDAEMLRVYRVLKRNLAVQGITLP